MRVIFIIAVFLISTLSGGSSFAASLGLKAETPSLNGIDPSVDYANIESPQRGYFDFLDAEPSTISGNPSSGDWDFDVSMFFSWNTVSGDPFLNASIEITGFENLTGDGQFYQGSNSAWGFVENVLEFHFSDLRSSNSTSEPELFGPSILVTLEMNFSLGSDPFQAIYNNRSAFEFGRDAFGQVDVNSVSANVPLPAGLPMLLAGLGVLAASARRSRS